MNYNFKLYNTHLTTIGVYKNYTFNHKNSLSSMNFYINHKKE
jgi:hypothetical protein